MRRSIDHVGSLPAHYRLTAERMPLAPSPAECQPNVSMARFELWMRLQLLILDQFTHGAFDHHLGIFLNFKILIFSTAKMPSDLSMRMTEGSSPKVAFHTSRYFVSIRNMHFHLKLPNCNPLDCPFPFIETVETWFRSLVRGSSMLANLVSVSCNQTALFEDENVYSEFWCFECSFNLFGILQATLLCSLFILVLVN